MWKVKTKEGGMCFLCAVLFHQQGTKNTVASVSRGLFLRVRRDHWYNNVITWSPSLETFLTLRSTPNWSPVTELDKHPELLQRQKCSLIIGWTTVIHSVSMKVRSKVLLHTVNCQLCIALSMKNGGTWVSLDLNSKHLWEFTVLTCWSLKSWDKAFCVLKICLSFNGY